MTQQKDRIRSIAFVLFLTLVFSVTLPEESIAKSKTIKIPTAPARVSMISAKQKNSIATVKWKKLKKNASGYAVYVKCENGNWKLAKNVNKKYSETSVKVGLYHKHSFRVRGYINYKTKNGKKKVKYGKYSATLTMPAIEKKPSTVTTPPENTTTPTNPDPSNEKEEIGSVFRVSGKISKGYGKESNKMLITLRWSSAKNATSYEVFRVSGKAKRYTKIATTKNTQFIDRSYDPRSATTYRIRGINSSKHGTPSNPLRLHPEWQKGTTIVKAYYPSTTCITCGKNITRMYVDDSIENEHYTSYYCSECGIENCASHNKADIEKHISEKHKGDKNVSVLTSTNLQVTTDPNSKEVISTTQVHTHSWVEDAKGYHCSQCDIAVGK